MILFEYKEFIPLHISATFYKKEYFFESIECGIIEKSLFYSTDNAQLCVNKYADSFFDPAKITST